MLYEIYQGTREIYSCGPPLRAAPAACCSSPKPAPSCWAANWPFLHQGVVQDVHWLSEQQSTDAVAVAMITPVPLVISVAFIGIFPPVSIPIAVLSASFTRHRDNAQLKAFRQGATAAIGLVSPGGLWRFKVVREPIVVAVAGLAGLAIWCVVHMGG